LKGSLLLSASAAHPYLVQGNLFELKAGQPVLLTEMTEPHATSTLVHRTPAAYPGASPPLSETTTPVTRSPPPASHRCDLNRQSPPVPPRTIQPRPVGSPAAHFYVRARDLEVHHGHLRGADQLLRFTAP
ncbi:hypothetical protein B1218_37780, partial [Pseudomonas ogarae]